MSQDFTVELHQRAPAKPSFGAPCNGCGACCAFGPCAVAYIWLFQFRGKCRALMWDEKENRYLCGMAAMPDEFMSMIPHRFRKTFGRFFATRIAAEAGCDFDAEVKML